LNVLKQHKNNIEPVQLRKIAIQYVTNYWRTIRNIVEGGTLEYASIGGQTLDEEISQQGFRWTSPPSSHLELSSEFYDSNITAYRKSVNGSDQIKRLIEEFRVVLQQISLPEFTTDSIVNSDKNGIYPNNNDSSALLSACRIASSYADQSLKFLVDQVSDRSAFILRRASEISKRFMTKSKNNKSIRDDDFSNYSYYFDSFVHENFNLFVDEMSEKFKNQAREEFYSATTLFWDFKLNPTLSSNSKNVNELADEVFEVIKDRIIRKVILLICNYFIFSITENLYGWDEIPYKIHTLSDSDLLQLFESDRQYQLILEKEEKLLKQYKSVEEKEIAIFGELIL